MSRGDWSEFLWEQAGMGLKYPQFLTGCVHTDSIEEPFHMGHPGPVMTCVCIYCFLNFSSVCWSNPVTRGGKEVFMQLICSTFYIMNHSILSQAYDTYCICHICSRICHGLYFPRTLTAYNYDWHKLQFPAGVANPHTTLLLADQFPHSRCTWMPSGCLNVTRRPWSQGGTEVRQGRECGRDVVRVCRRSPCQSPK